MTAAKPTNNATFTAIREFFMSYIAFPNPVYADICALWCMATHVYEEFDTFGYIIITASTKRAGKTTLAELMSMVSRKSAFGTSMTASVMRRLIASGSTMFFDEAESLNSEAASAQREYLNAGNRKGGKVYMPGAGPDEVIEYEAFGPKAFILIGDVNDTLRDRSIPIELMRGKAPKPYRRTPAEQDAAAINISTESMRAMFEADADRMAAFDVYEYLDGREAEIWNVILTFASVYAPQSFNDIVKTAIDLNSLKDTTDKRTFREIKAEAEDQSKNEQYGERAMRDLHSVFKHGERALFTDEAIERMKQVLTGPWRAYKGTGLTQNALADLLKPMISTKTVKINGKVKRGFQRADVDAAFKKLG